MNAYIPAEDIPAEVAAALHDKVWVETAPCGCQAAAVVARFHPTKTLALRALGRRKEVLPLTLVDYADIHLGCHHAPKWKSPAGAPPSTQGVLPL